MKCTSCTKTIETTFLGKIIGTTVGSGKNRKPYCNECQKKAVTKKTNSE